MVLAAHRNSMLGFAAAALVLAAVGVVVVATALRFIQDSRWVAHTSEVLTEVDTIAALQSRAIAVQRGYMLAGVYDMRSEFWEVKAEIPRHLRTLDAIVQYKPVVALLQELEPKLRQRLALAATTLEVHEQKGLQAAQAYMKTNGSRALDLQIHALLEDIRDRETRLLESRRLASERSANWLLATTIGGIPLSLIMIAAVYRMLVRENAERQKSERLAQASATSFRKISGNMEALSKYAGALQSCDGAAELLAITRQAFMSLMPGLSGTVYLIRASRDHAEVAVQWGQHTAPSAILPMPSECWAVRRNQLYSCKDVHADIACAHVEIPQAGVAAATACLPLSAQGQLMGWLYLSGPGPGPLPDLELALQAAEQFSLALANIRLREDLRHQSIRDPLTGLFNRRYLEESLAREISRCQRRKLPLVVLMLDLDNFKAFNDHHGHPGGDALLSAFGRLLQANCRPEDIACRFGGEEFTVILPEAEMDIGVSRAKAILAATAQMVISHQGVPLGRVTTSIGMAVLPEHGTTNTSLLAAADKALYQAKSDGRNRLCVAGLGSGLDPDQQ